MTSQVSPVQMELASTSANDIVTHNSKSNDIVNGTNSGKIYDKHDNKIIGENVHNNVGSIIDNENANKRVIHSKLSSFNVSKSLDFIQRSFFRYLGFYVGRYPWLPVVLGLILLAVGVAGLTKFVFRPADKDMLVKSKIMSDGICFVCMCTVMYTSGRRIFSADTASIT